VWGLISVNVSATCAGKKNLFVIEISAAYTNESFRRGMLYFLAGSAVNEKPFAFATAVVKCSG
jgi:hypothetical protein